MADALLREDKIRHCRSFLGFSEKYLTIRYPGYPKYLIHSKGRLSISCVPLASSYLGGNNSDPMSTLPIITPGEVSECSGKGIFVAFMGW